MPLWVEIQKAEAMHSKKKKTIVTPHCIMQMVNIVWVFHLGKNCGCVLWSILSCWLGSVMLHPGRASYIHVMMSFIYGRIILWSCRIKTIFQRMIIVNVIIVMLFALSRSDRTPLGIVPQLIGIITHYIYCMYFRFYQSRTSIDHATHLSLHHPLNLIIFQLSHHNSEIGWFELSCNMAHSSLL